MLGVSLLKEVVSSMWIEKQKHVECIQDPLEIELYTTIGQLKKSHVTLSVFRYVRGSTSVESFHLHLIRFVPGS